MSKLGVVEGIHCSSLCWEEFMLVSITTQILYDKKAFGIEKEAAFRLD